MTERKAIGDLNAYFDQMRAHVDEGGFATVYQLAALEAWDREDWYQGQAWLRVGAMTEPGA